LANAPRYPSTCCAFHHAHNVQRAHRCVGYACLLPHLDTAAFRHYSGDVPSPPLDVQTAHHDATFMPRTYLVRLRGCVVPATVRFGGLSHHSPPHARFADRRVPPVATACFATYLPPTVYRLTWFGSPSAMPAFYLRLPRFITLPRIPTFFSSMNMQHTPFPPTCRTRCLPYRLPWRDVSYTPPPPLDPTPTGALPHTQLDGCLTIIVEPSHLQPYFAAFPCCTLGGGEPIAVTPTLWDHTTFFFFFFFFFFLFFLFFLRGSCDEATRFLLCYFFFFFFFFF